MSVAEPMAAPGDAAPGASAPGASNSAPDPLVAPGTPAVDAAPETQSVPWPHRHLLDVDVLAADEIDLVMRTTDAMREVLARPIAKVPALRGRNVTILFYEASTRTRVSFEVAAKNLSADVVNIAAATSSVTKGESLVDTVRTIEALGADMLVMRHSASGAPYLAAEIFGGSVLNGGDGWHAHPTQALLDLYTIREHLAPTTSVPSVPQTPGEPAPGLLAGRKVVILGDLLHSRVARSNIWTLTAAGADLWLCGPSTLLRGFEAWASRGAAGRRFTVTSDIDAALRDADVVMALRIQRERMASGLLPSLREYAARYGLTRARLAAARPDVVVMHPGPMNEGVEIAPDVAAGPNSVISGQVTNGVAVRMALLYLLAGTRESGTRGGGTGGAGTGEVATRG
ncbi:MAG TPA: aspartate carbamoyltransferase catalytic subunit [Candidatus Limnocylindrales bacterium]|nr:aspartate carbamoyltransferase catalytic subunit [Candidatus Limnocylindrales bacterium]